MNEFFDIELARKCSPNKNNYHFLNLIYRKWWHVVFDNAPQLLKFLANKDKFFLEEFLKHLGYNHCLNERIHLFLIDYLNKHKKISLPKEILEELIVSFCALWIKTNVSEFRQVLIYSQQLNSIIIGKKIDDFESKASVDFYKNEKYILKGDLCILEIQDDFDLIDNFIPLIPRLARYDSRK